MRKTISLLVSISCCLLVNAQIYLANNGLTSSGTGTSTTVSLGGTLNNAATSIDFGSSNSSSNFLLKKGTSNYFFVGNDGKLGIGTITPSTLVDLNGSLNVTGASTLGGTSTNAPAQLVINYLGASQYAGKGIKLVDNTSGSIIRLHTIGNQLYLTKDDGTPGSLVIGTIGNPTDGSQFRAGFGRWELSAGSFSVNQSWTGIGQFEMTIASATTKGMVIKAASSQTANLQEWQNSAGSVINVINSAGSVGIGNSAPNTNAKLDVTGNIFSSGKIAIGTTDMVKIGSYSLAVNGDALFNKVKVKLYANWPDYVFHHQYDLPSLNDVEKFIRENNHLPEVPSALEVEKNGLDIGDNQAMLLKKIEELTLYLIEQNKKIEEQQKRIDALEKRMNK